MHPRVPVELQKLVVPDFEQAATFVVFGSSNNIAENITPLLLPRHARSLLPYWHLVNKSGATSLLYITRFHERLISIYGNICGYI